MEVGFESGGVRLLPWGNFGELAEIVKQVEGPVIGLVCSGNLRMMINGEANTISANQMFILLKDMAVSNIKPSKACRGFVLILKNRYFSNIDIPTSDIFTADLIVRTTYVFDVEEQITEMMLGAIANMCQVVQASDLYFNNEVLHSCAMGFCYLVMSVLMPKAKKHQSVDDKSESHMSRFIELLSENYTRERSVEYYAAEIGITPKYLTLLCHKYRGKSASKVIDDVVIHSAMRLLKQPGVSILEVAEQLNFPSQSFFGKYFKQRVGISPSRYKGQGL